MIKPKMKCKKMKRFRESKNDLSLEAEDKRYSKLAICESVELLSEVTEGNLFHVRRCFFNPVSGQLELGVDFGQGVSCCVSQSSNMGEGGDHVDGAEGRDEIRRAATVSNSATWARIKAESIWIDRRSPS
ncbi:hypothetical protein V6N12_025344 [Hibiscus sabdariffa]|uniref:Uncharacterized protein n=1 Tax=Hibiscus sabdariffa TaxID=183260 RepID=A0ABR2CI58_9ROSI